MMMMLVSSPFFWSTLYVPCVQSMSPSYTMDSDPVAASISITTSRPQQQSGAESSTVGNVYPNIEAITIDRERGFRYL